MDRDGVVLAREQAALRRVATVVAGGTAPEEVFAAVVEEVGRLLPAECVYMGRFDPEDAMTFVSFWSATAGAMPPIGSRWMLGGHNVSTVVFKTGRPARLKSIGDASGPIGLAFREGGVRSAVGTPIVVDGRLWGVMIAISTLEQPMPADTEARLTSFTQLLAAAVANAESRAGLDRLASEQAALRRVATLVARGTPQDELFAAVTAEIGRLLLVELVVLGRYAPDGALAFVAGWGRAAGSFGLGTRQSLEGHNLGTIVFNTGCSARIDDYAEASGPLGIAAREAGFRSAVGTPITVEGSLWGVVIAGWSLERPLPVDTEGRLASFTELLATAIANAENGAALAASRARVVAAADETRRRIERDLHDGTQQQLVSLILELRAVNAREPSDVDELKARLTAAERGIAGIMHDLREISRGIHPAIVSRGGLGPALTALAHRSAVPVELDLHIDGRLAEHVEVAVYYVVSEALTNAAKHAHASVINVGLEARAVAVRLTIRDDGVGGADPRAGSGLVGLSDRIEALGGTLAVTSPAGRGTTLVIDIPLDGHRHAASLQR